MSKSLELLHFEDLTIKNFHLLQIHLIKSVLIGIWKLMWNVDVQVWSLLLYAFSPSLRVHFFHIYLFWNAIHLLLFMFISHFQKFVISNVNLICCKSLFCCSLPSPARELFVFYRPNNTTLQTTWSQHPKIRQIQEKKQCQKHNRSKALRTLTH